MSLMPNAPQSIGGVLDHGLRLYRHAVVPCIPLALVASILSAFPALWLSLHMEGISPTDTRALLSIYASPAIWGTFLLVLLPLCVIYGALFARIDAIARGEQSTLGAALGVGLRRTPAILGVGILFMLMIFVGMCLLLIPGIYLWGVFQFAIAAAVLERAGVFGSLGISFRLVKGNWWRANAIMFIAFVIMFVLIVVIGIIVGIAVAMGGIPRPGALSTGQMLIQQGLSSVLNLFVMSFLPCVMLSVYYDLKLRNEGSDLASRVEALN
ncbi:MAG: hypothetical protein ABI645_06135 [Pseudomonadota bacterium]